MMLGGIRLAMVDAEAMSAAVKARSYPSLSISGATVRLRTATSAIDEPEMPAKNMLNSVTTWASPPRRCPTSVCDSRIMRCDDVGRSHQFADQQEKRDRKQRLGIDAVEKLPDHRLHADLRESRCHEHAGDQCEGNGHAHVAEQQEQDRSSGPGPRRRCHACIPRAASAIRSHNVFPGPQDPRNRVSSR